jgi:transketolase
MTAEGTKHELKKWPQALDTSNGKKNTVTIVANGSLLPEAVKAADLLEAKGFGAIVLHGSSVNHPDLATVKAALAKSAGRLVTVEDHRTVGGMGALLTHALVIEGVALKLKSLGVGDKFGQSAYSALDLYKAHGLDSQSISTAAQSLL